jgi:1,4-alpha-glucan branching enzyme
MAAQTIEFQYLTGLKREIFRNARLRGSWDSSGRFSNDWTELPMHDAVGEDGCPMFRASVALDLADRHRTFKWGVVLDGPQGSSFWGIPTEVQDVNSVERFRTFQLSGAPAQTERYYFTYGRRLGANKQFTPGSAVAGLRFSVWAPNARRVDVVFGTASGYIADDGTGIDATKPLRRPDAIGRRNLGRQRARDV